MSSSAKNTTFTTRTRILDAAAKVFAQQGLEGATTRAISHQAKVNEVTLFRHFLNKEKLLDAVLHRTFEQQEAAARSVDTEFSDQSPTPMPPTFRAELLSFAQRYEVLLRNNILLLRTLLGEIHRHREHEARMLRCIFAPLKTELVDAIRSARERGTIRAEVEPTIAADLFSSVIFVDVLRRSLHSEPEYSAEQYLSAAIDLFARGIEQ